MSWWFSPYYDRAMVGLERRVFGAWRAALLADVGGVVLDLGAGTGANLPYFREVDRLICVEPDEGMRSRCAERAAALGVSVELVDASGERLPMPNASVDVVVSALVLCTVSHPDRVAEQLFRVLKPGGRLIFIEHVADPSGWNGLLQRLLNPLWRACAGGCELTRDTGSTLEAAGFVVEQLTEERVPMAVILGPIIRGVARRP